MKEQWEINENNLAALEKGLQEEKQECETSSCKQWLRYIKLIFLLEITLFLGWGCYMILETYHVRITKNKVTNVTHERYPPIFGSLFEVQKTHPSTEMPVIYVKPEVILNNFLEDIELTKKQDLMQDKAIAADIDSTMRSRMQNPVNVQDNNMMGTNDVDDSLVPLLWRDSVHDIKIKKLPMPLTTFSPVYIDKIINTDKSEESARSPQPFYTQFVEKVRNIVKSNNIEKFEKEYEDSNRLTLDSQKNNVLDTSDKPESLEYDDTIYDGFTTISNIEDSVDRKISVNLTNSLQNSEEKFSDLIEDAVQKDRSEKSFFSDKTNKGMKAHLEPDLVICPPYQSHESSDMSLERSDKASSISQAVSTQESSEQIGNASGDEDKHDVDDSNMSMSTSWDASHFGNNEGFTFDVLVRILSNIEDEISSENSANVKEDEKYESKENIKSMVRIFPKTQDSVGFVTSNDDDFRWYNAPARFADDLSDQFRSKDVPKSSKIQIPYFQDTYEDSIEIIYPNSENKCFMNIMMDILKVKCPGIKFDEEWNLTSSEINTPYVLNVDDLEDAYDDYDYEERANGQWDDWMEFIYDENSDKKIATLQHSIPKLMVSELQESTPSAKAPNDASLNLANIAEIDSFDTTKVSQDDTIYSSNEGEIQQEMTTISTSIPESGIIIDSKRWNPFLESSVSGIDTIDVDKERNSSPEIPAFRTPVIGSGEEPNLSSEISDPQQQEQSEITEKQDSKNIKTLLKNYETIDALKKKVTSMFNTEMLRLMNQQYPPVSSYGQDYFNNICNFYPYICSSEHLWPQQYDDVKKSLEHIRNDYNNRKKRMTDDLTWQQEQVSNVLEEGNKNMDILENLRKLFMKMEILAACIDKLHERYLLHNKLDDDYVSSEFPIETENVKNPTYAYKR